MASVFSGTSLDFVRQSLRGFFIDELRLDQGWSDFIDELLAELDLEALYYLQRDGFPYLLSSDFYRELFGRGALPSGGSSTQVDASGTTPVSTVISGGYVYFVFNPAGENTSAYVPFAGWGPVSVESFICGPVVSENAAKSWVCEVADGSAVSIGAGGVITIKSSGFSDKVEMLGGMSPTFVIRVSLGAYEYYLNHLEDPGGVVFGLRQMSIPTEVNMAAVRVARGVAGTGSTLGGIRVDSESIYSRLLSLEWSVADGAALKRVPLPFQLVFLGRNNYTGVAFKEWSNYFTPVEVRSFAADGSVGSVVPTEDLRGMALLQPIYVVSGAPCLASGLSSQFFWGSGSSLIAPGGAISGDPANGIYGYDKRLWVVANNYSRLDETTATGAYLPDKVSRSNYLYAELPAGDSSVSGGGVSGVSALDAAGYVLSSELSDGEEEVAGSGDWYPTADPGFRWPEVYKYLAFGLHQEYIGRTFPSGDVSAVLCVFSSTRGEVAAAMGYEDGPEFEAYLAYIRNLMLRSMPVGVDFRFQFGDPEFVVNLGMTGGFGGKVDPQFSAELYKQDGGSWVKVDFNIEDSLGGEYRLVIRSNSRWAFKN